MQKNIVKKGLTFAVVILFIFMSITPSSAFDNVKKSPTPTFDGNTLYVGGTGPDNYTRIQDAINDADSGDTVFVYHDSSPYNESLNIDKSITLQGENMTTTFIYGWSSISSDYVIITSFTFWRRGPALSISGFSNNIIENCIFYESASAIHLTDKSNNNTIRNCNFSQGQDHNFVLVISGSNNNEISYCDFIDNNAGHIEPTISIISSQQIKIHHCNITRNYYGGVRVLNSVVSLTSNNIFNNDGPGVELRFLSFGDLRHNWWGSPQGPSIEIGTGWWFFLFLHKESVMIRSVENGEVVFFHSPKSLIGIPRLFPWVSEPVSDAGQQI